MRTPASLKGEAEQAGFAALAPDLAVVVAYGLLLPRPILEAPRRGCLNGHASILPRWRGAAPIQRAIMAGDTETGISVMRMEEGLDTGPVALIHRIAIGPDTTAGELHDALAGLCAKSMVEARRAARGRRAFLRAPARRGRDLREKDRQGRDAHRLGHAGQRSAQPHPRPVAVSRRVVRDRLGGKPERLKLLRSTLAEGAGAPGEVLDDGLTVACGEGAVRLVERAARRRQAGGGGATSCAACGTGRTGCCDPASV